MLERGRYETATADIRSTASRLRKSLVKFPPIIVHNRGDGGGRGNAIRKIVPNSLSNTADNTTNRKRTRRFRINTDGDRKNARRVALTTPYEVRDTISEIGRRV